MNVRCIKTCSFSIKLFKISLNRNLLFFNKMIERLTIQKMQLLMERSEPTLISLKFPVFNINHQQELIPMIKFAGLHDLFDEKKCKNLAVSNIVMRSSYRMDNQQHTIKRINSGLIKAKIRDDPKSHLVELDEDAKIMDDKIKHHTVNKPFIFTVMHTFDNELVLVGKVNNPLQQ